MSVSESVANLFSGMRYTIRYPSGRIYIHGL